MAHKLKSMAGFKMACFIAVFALFLVPSASAWVLPSSSYSAQEKTYTLSAALGTWKIADVKLLENTDNCLIDCKARLQYTFYDDVTPKEYAINFYNKENSKVSIERNKDYIVTTETYDVNVKDYGLCDFGYSTIDNKTSELIKVVNMGNCEKGNHIEKRTREKLTEIDMSSYLFKGGQTYIIEIQGKKKPFQSVDWIQNFDGFVMDNFAWWNTTYQNKKPVYIKEKDGKSSGQPVMVNVSYDSDMQADFSDLVFTNETETGIIYHGKEQIVSSNYALIWLNVTLNASTNHTFYMYYKNSSIVSDLSNQTRVFNFSDNFSRADKNGLDNLETGQAWSYSGNTTPSEFRINGSRMQVSATGNHMGIATFGDITKNLSVEFIISAAVANPSEPSFFMQNSAGTNIFGCKRDATTGNFYCRDNVDWNPLDVSTAWALNTNYSIKFILYANSSFLFYVNGGLKTAKSVENALTPNRIKFNENGGAATVYFVDAFRAMTVPATNSTVSFGDEATGTTPSVTLNYPSNAITTTNTTILFNCSATSESILSTPLKNLSLYVWDSLNNVHLTSSSTISGTSNSSAFSGSVSPNESSYKWNCLVYDTLGNFSWASNRTFLADYNLGQCNATYQIPTLNYTLWDETNNNQTNASISSLAIKYWTDNYLKSKTFSYDSSGVSNNSNYTFCLSPNITSQLNVNYNISYKQGADYPQRNLLFQTLNLTNSTVTEKKIYLLNVLDGLYVTFQTINSALSPLSDVSITLTRLIGSTTITMAAEITDSSGSVSLWLNPLVSHTLTAIKSGYSTYTSTLIPAQSAYTITMNSLSASNVTDTISGINYSISPINSTLNNSNLYTFSLFILDSNSNLDGYGFNLTNSTGYIIYQTTGALAGGETLSASINTKLNSTFVMRVYYIVDGKTSLINKQWNIYNMTSDQYSINKVFTDLKTYTDAGMFGINSFSLTLIIFIVIFISTGIMCYNFGIYSPAAISAMIFGETALFDMGLNLIVNPIGAIPYFPTFFVGLIMTALIIKEATSY